MFKRLYNIHKKHDINFNKEARIFTIFAIAFLIILLVIGTNYHSAVESSVKDVNVYLNEEVCYAGGIYLKVNSINVITNEVQKGKEDQDGDTLSEYTLNLGLNIERRGGNFWTNTVKIKSNYFSLKSVNLESRSPMAIFFETLAKETVAASIGIALDGSINVIDETIGIITEFSQEMIDNASNKPDFKPIKCAKNQFEPFKPKEGHDPYRINIAFPIKQEYLESKNLIVLSIDQINHWEQRIFLTKRPSLE